MHMTHAHIQHHSNQLACGYIVLLAGATPCIIHFLCFNDNSSYQRATVNHVWVPSSCIVWALAADLLEPGDVVVSSSVNASHLKITTLQPSAYSPAALSVPSVGSHCFTCPVVTCFKSTPCAAATVTNAFRSRRSLGRRCLCLACGRFNNASRSSASFNRLRVTTGDVTNWLTRGVLLRAATCNTYVTVIFWNRGKGGKEDCRGSMSCKGPRTAARVRQGTSGRPTIHVVRECPTRGGCGGPFNDTALQKDASKAASHCNFLCEI